MICVKNIRIFWCFLGERLRAVMYLAVEFLDELKDEAEDFYKKTKEERNTYFEKNHFFH